MTAAGPPSQIHLRPALDEDRAFLFEVYASTRAEELAPVPWTPEQKRAFLAQQFDAQDRDYRARYQGAEYLIIERDGRSAGRLYLFRSSSDLLVMDIALLPPSRGQGVGTRILTALLLESTAAGRTVSLHVETFNPAQRLYERLGFRVAQESGIYRLMIKEPSA